MNGIEVLYLNHIRLIGRADNPPTPQKGSNVIQILTARPSSVTEQDVGVLKSWDSIYFQIEL